MIDENEIMPFNFFKYGGVYSGEHKGMRYIIKRVGDKPDFLFKAMCWQGPYASTAVLEDAITTADFEFSEEGRLQAIQWLKEQYGERIDEWNNAPSILKVKPVIHE
ncbi:MAG: hypothetical protein ACI4E1_05225 [Lachnospira sp.]